MLYLVFGKDKKRVNDFVSSEKNKVSNLEVSIVEFPKASLESLKIELSTVSMFAENRLVLVKNILKNCKEELDKDFLAGISKSKELTAIFIEDEDPDQRIKNFKLLKEVATLKPFAEPNAAEVQKFAQNYIKKIGGSISPNDLAYLMNFLGNDLTLIENELQKLVTYDKAITRKSIELLVSSSALNNIFELTDSISKKNQEASVNTLNKILDSGENEIYVLTMLSMQIRNLMLVKDLHEHRLNEQEIVKKSKLHPFVVKKTLSMVKNFDMVELVKLHRELLEIDMTIKSQSVNPSGLIQDFTVRASTK